MTTLWEYFKLVYYKFEIESIDTSIYNILHNNKLTRKRVRSKFYPEKTEGQKKQILKSFIKNQININIIKQFVQMNQQYI